MIKITCTGSHKLPWKELKPFQGDLKKLSDANYNKLKKEIEENGFSFPFFVWPFQDDYFLIDGHQRLATLHRMAKESIELPIEFPVAMIEASNIKEAKRKVLAATSSYGEMSNESLFDFLNEADLSINDTDTSFRFPEIDFDFLKEKENEGQEKDDSDQDSVPETSENELGVKLGDLWQLGEHRLLCGDSTVKENVDRLLGGVKVDMVYTDPPYGIDVCTDWTSLENKSAYKASPNSSYLSKRKSYKKIENDNIKIDINFIFDVNAKQNIIFGGNYFAQVISPEIYINGSYLVWDKNGGSESLDKGPGSSFELAFLYPKRKQSIIYRTWRGIYGRGDGSGFLKDKVSMETKTTVHPTQKPVRLAIQIFEKIAKDEWTNILDLFLGSGSTLIACEKTNRKCYGMEIDPHYCSVIIKRWEEYTGKKAQLL